MDHTYWQKQAATKPLFPDIEWSKPEQRSRAGKLGIVGGNKLGFVGVAEGYQTALQTGVGAVRVLLPSGLKKTIPPVITDVVFSPNNPSGSLSKDALGDLLALGEWASGVLLIGDAGRNSETAILYEQFLERYGGPVTITRDAVDLMRNNPEMLARRPNTLLVLSFAQLQKLFRELYYPKVLTFSMQLLQLVEALHKFTITYPITITTLHRDQIIVAHSGRIVTQEFTEPMRIWRGEIAARAASWYLWNEHRPLEAVATALRQSD